MKTYGDIPRDHENLIKELCTLLEFLMLNKDSLPHLMFSKSMTCIAHDYFAIEMEEEAQRYLIMAAEHSPGYFMAPIFCEMKIDPLFNHLVNDLKENPFAIRTMTELGFSDE